MIAESSYPSIGRITYPFASTHVPLSLSWTPVLTKERTLTVHSLRAGHRTLHASDSFMVISLPVPDYS